MKFSLVLLLILGLALRLVNLNQSFWLDEASQAQMSAMSVSDIWFERSADFHPPLFYFLAHAWMQLGRSEVWLRLLPVSFGILNLLVLYRLAGLISSRSVRLGPVEISFRAIAVFLLAVSPFHIYYSQEFRSYSLLSFLGTMSMYWLYRRNFFWLTITNSLLIYTHYSAFFLLPAQLAYLIFYNRRDLGRFITSLFWSTILYLPWLPQFSRQLSGGVNIDAYLPGWRQVLSISPVKAFPTTMFKLVAGRISFLSRGIYGLYIVFVFAVTFMALLIARRSQAFLFVWAFIPVLVMLVVSVALPQNQPFRVIFVLPALLILFTAAISRFPKLFLTLFIYIALVGNLAYFTRPRLQREQWRQAIGFLVRENRPVVVKFSDRFAPFLWYSPGLSVLPAVPVFPAQPRQVAARLESLRTAPRVYLLDYLGDLTDPGRSVDAGLADLGFTPTVIHDFPGVGFVRTYENRP